MRGADAVGEHEWQPARSSLVHDDRPGLALREQCEDVRGDVELDDPLPLDVTREHEAHSEVARQQLETRALRSVARENEQQSRIARLGNRADEHVEPLFGRESRDGQDDDVVGCGAERAPQLRPPGREPRGVAGELVDVDRVREHVHALGLAPRATIEFRASVPVTRTPDAFVTTGGTTVFFTLRRQPGRGPSSWLSTTRTYGTFRTRHQAIAPCAANVLQPDTTTTSGRASFSAGTTPGVSG